MSNPHKADLSAGGYAYPNGKQMAFDRKHPEGMSPKQVCWEGLRVNHYVIKSYEEFKTRKQPRGVPPRAASASTDFLNNMTLMMSAATGEPWLPSLNEEIGKVLDLLATRERKAMGLNRLQRGWQKWCSKLYPSPVFELQPVRELYRAAGLYRGVRSATTRASE